MWNKVEKTKVVGRGARAVPAVSRCRTGARGACVILPEAMVMGARASIYSDGNGKLAFAMGERGDFKVYGSTKVSRQRNIAIPKPWAERIPFGVTDVTLARDGDMLVLDLNSLPPA